jgi:hypothetical protein
MSKDMVTSSPSPSDLFEGGLPCRTVHAYQIGLKMDVDAPALGHLVQLRREQRHGEQSRAVGEEVQMAASKLSAALQMIGGQVGDLLRRSRALER